MKPTNQKLTKLTPKAKREVLAWLGPKFASQYLASHYKVTPEILSLAYSICKDEKLLNELFSKAELRARQAKTERMRQQKNTLLQSLRPVMSSLVAVFETDDGDGFVCDPDVEVCEDPNAGQHGNGNGGGHGGGDSGGDGGNGFDWGGLLVLVVVILLSGG